MTEPGELTRAEFYDRIRGQIEHEDELINLRVVWQLLAQSFFFSTYATLLNAQEQAKNAVFEAQQQVLVWMVPVAALAAGLLTYVSILTALSNINHLRRLYEQYAEQKRDDPSSNLFPAIQGPRHLRMLAQVGPIGLPLLFILTWLIIVIRLIIDPAA